MNVDDLASIRTHLANERTVLAYVRTSLAFLAAGAGLIEFFSSPISTLLAWTFIAVGGFVLVIGLARFVHARRRINKLST